MPIATAIIAASAIGGGAMLGSAAMGGGGGDIEQSWNLGPEQLKMFQDIMALAAPGVGGPLPSYPGERLAPRHPLEELLGQFYEGAAPGAMGMGGILGQVMEGYDPSQAWGYLQQAQAPMEQMLAKFDPASATRLWEQSVRQPGMEAWGDIQEQIREANVRGGRGSSGYLNTALAEAGGDLATQMSSQLGQMIYGGEQAQLGRQQSGINQLMNLIGQPGQIVGQGAGIQDIGAQILSQAGQAGAGQRGYQQEILDMLRGKWEEQQQPTWMDLAPLIFGRSPEQYYQQPEPGIGSVIGPALAQLVGGEGFQSLLGGGQQYGGTTSYPAGIQANPWYSSGAAGRGFGGWGSAPAGGGWGTQLWF